MDNVSDYAALISAPFFLSQLTQAIEMTKSQQLEAGFLCWTDGGRVVVNPAFIVGDASGELFLCQFDADSPLISDDDLDGVFADKMNVLFERWHHRPLKRPWDEGLVYLMRGASGGGSFLPHFVLCSQRRLLELYSELGIHWKRISNGSINYHVVSSLLHFHAECRTHLKNGFEGENELISSQSRRRRGDAYWKYAEPREGGFAEISRLQPECIFEMGYSEDECRRVFIVLLVSRG